MLGLGWKPSSDELSFRWRQVNILGIRWTKEQISSHIGRLFDSQGFLGPIMIIPKLLLQSLHRDKIPWGASVPIAVQDKWIQWYEELSVIISIRIPRWIDFRNVIRIHGYADASEVAYGAVLYAECEEHGERTLKILASKSRIAPLKTLLIPRLELCAALLLSSLAKSVMEALDVKVPVSLWSDSMVCLHWLKTTALLKVFVHKRVQKINDLTASWTWNYVKSEDNPADVLSRGLMPRDIERCSMWWNGPHKRDSTGAALSLSE